VKVPGFCTEKVGWRLKCESVNGLSWLTGLFVIQSLWTVQLFVEIMFHNTHFHALRRPVASLTKNRKRRFRIGPHSVSEGAHPLCDALSRRGLTPIKVAIYDLRRPDGKCLYIQLYSPSLTDYSPVCQQSWSQGLLLRRTRHLFPSGDRSHSHN